MPWNDNANPGPWGSPPPSGDRGGPDRNEPGRGPRRPGGPDRTPPDLEELQRRLTAAWRRMSGAPGGGDLPPERWLPMVGGALAALYLASGVIVVGAREEAVVTTFGAWTRSYGPGIDYHLPLIERAQKVDITSLEKTEVGDDTGGDAEEGLMLTGDENIVDLTFSVNWRVSNPGQYLFNIKDQDETVKAVAESAMREVVGRSALDPIISSGRGRIQTEAAALMQRILDSYQAGIIVDSVQIRDAQPPKEVVAAFQDVATAGQNAEASINAARGEAAKIRQQALGYRAQVVSEAQGEAARFNQIYMQYKLAPGVTRDRLYIETMQRVLANSNRVIIDSKGAAAPIVLPADAFRPRASVAAPAAAPRAAGGSQ